ncbi:DoxX family protein [Pseudovibrio axinellae]|nr:DoxX family protein [Pseudovibrio axinellae]
MLVSLYQGVFGWLDRVTNGWFLGLAARFLFAGVLFMYFWNSALLKFGDGAFGFLFLSAGAYAQILPQITEAAGYDVSQIAFFPYGIIVLLGTWGEIIIPVLIVVGLFTRAASVGFIGFVIVMSIVDVVGHGVDLLTLGALFDRHPSALIFDQRALWIFLATVLVIRGPGVFSLDWALGKAFGIHHETGISDTKSKA